MIISIIFGVNQDVIQVHNDEDVKLLRKDLVDVPLEACWCVCQTEKHHLILEVAISSPERCFPLVSFADFHLVVCTGEVELCKSFSSS